MKKAIFVIVITNFFALPTLAKNEPWAFWYLHDNGQISPRLLDIYQERYDSQDECIEAQIKWQGDPTLPPIIFSCARMDQELLARVERNCSSGSTYACTLANELRLWLRGAWP